MQTSSGFTLVEMLVVITIMSVLFGISSAFYTKFEDRFNLSNATLHTASMLRQAKEMAREQDNTTVCKVVLPNQIEFWGTRLVGFWHCDTLESSAESANSNVLITPGAFGMQARGQNLQIMPGKIRQSLYFAPESKLECATWGKLNLQQGMLLSFWVYPERLPNYEMGIAKFASYFAISINADYRLVVRTEQERFTSKSSIPLYQWSHLKIRWHNQQLVIYCNQILLIQESLAIPKIPSYIYLELGGGYRGRLDQVEVRFWNLLDIYQIPNEVAILEAPKEIRFQGRGSCEFVGNSIHQIVLSKNNEHRSQIVLSPWGDIRYQLPNQ